MTEYSPITTPADEAEIRNDLVKRFAGGVGAGALLAACLCVPLSRAISSGLRDMPMNLPSDNSTIAMTFFAALAFLV